MITASEQSERISDLVNIICFTVPKPPGIVGEYNDVRFDFFGHFFEELKLI